MTVAEEAVTTAFREEWGRIVATLIRATGIVRLWSWSAPTRSVASFSVGSRKTPVTPDPPDPGNVAPISAR